MITVTRPSNTGTEVRFTTSNGLILPIPAVATTTPETGEMVRPRLEACSIGIIRNAGLSPIFAASDGANSTNA
ncbi:Uncharacterised protein [Vibrio cholerae]|uniref:Uncharacterized protein n=1 Tax=Vibrio cholerae TaxID=666 RepID=A0A655Y8F1_VIBCL|nr:Uncharacterised protein [Vibrio cholerae]